MESRQLLPPSSSGVVASSSTASSAPRSSMLGSIVNLTNTIIGAGLLSIPFAFRVAGIVPALLCLVGIWLLSSLSFDVLARSAEYTGKFTYKEIAITSAGPAVGYFAEFCIMVYTFLNLIGRMIILADFLTTVFGSNLVGLSAGSVLTQRWFIIVMVSLVIFPLTILRRIDMLKFTSFLSLLCVLFTSVVVVIMYDFTKVPVGARLAIWPESADAFIAFGILVVSFCAHYNIPAQYEELQDRSPAKMRVVIFSSTTICAILYSVVGIMGYLTCLDDTQGNVLSDYAPNVIRVTVARLALSVAIIFSSPLVLYACRRAFLTLFMSRFKDPISGQYSWFIWIVIPIVLQSLVGLIAVVLKQIQVVYGYSGAIIGVTFVFFLPGLFFIKLASRRGYHAATSESSLNADTVCRINLHSLLKKKKKKTNACILIECGESTFKKATPGNGMASCHLRCDFVLFRHGGIHVDCPQRCPCREFHQCNFVLSGLKETRCFVGR